MLRMPRMAAVLGAALTALLIGGVAMAQESPPHTFYGFEGDVTIDGENAPAGTEILASTGDSATVGEDGSWSIEVAGGSQDVSFTVAGSAVEGAHPAPAGGVTRVMLAAATAADECPDGMDMSGDSMGEDSLSEGDAMDEGAMDDCPDDAMDEDGAMDEGESMGEDHSAAGDGGEFPGTGTGGLADSSSSSAAYAIAGALALVALLGGAGVAIRRRVQS